MLITEDGILHPLTPENVRTFSITNRINNILKINPEQPLYSYPYSESLQLLLTPTMLNKLICLYRITLRNIEGALHAAASEFGMYNINILISEDVRLGNVVIWEVIADFSNTKKSHEEFDSILRDNSYITAVDSEKLLDIIPDLKFLETPKEIQPEFDISNDTIKISLPYELLVKEVGINWSRESRIVITSYSRIPVLSIQFFKPNDKLVKIDTCLKDEPGTLAESTNAIKELVDLRASSARMPIPGVKSPWRAFGILKKENTQKVKQVLEHLTCTIGPVEVVPLGWHEGENENEQE